jgi:uncharacterized protein (TIGR02996 family)
VEAVAGSAGQVSLLFGGGDSRMTGIQADAWEEHDAFLQMAHETPEDDTPRLIYADWLEERGDATWAAYAEFIRNQIESTKLKNRSKHRQEELLAAHARAWLGPWADVPYRWVYRRGIPEHLHARATGGWIGRRLGADWGFPDRVEFREDGRITVDFGDINWPGMYPTVAGTYQVRFSFAWVHVAIQLWQVEKRTLQYEGRLTNGGLRLELEEKHHVPTPAPECVQLDLKAPDRWWP